MHINYTINSGIEYAKVCNSIREGDKVRKETVRYLGRVIDREKGIYQNRENGLYAYDLATDTVHKVPPDYESPKIIRKNARRMHKMLGLSFGDVFLIEEFLRKTGFKTVIDAINYANMDSLYSGILYYVVQSRTNSHAYDWWSMSYASILYPHAKIQSQRFSEMLEDVGEEDVKRNFFSAYFKFLDSDFKLSDSRGLKMVVDDGILIDSTGLPNTCHLPCTALSNHNGEVSVEVRLIYAVQQYSGMPLFYRYVPGNVIDATTVRKTINELKANRIQINWVLIDAGYYTAPNADAMIKENISFITRVGTKHKIYKEAVKKFRETIMSPKNAYIHEKRLYYIVETECMIGTKEDKRAYGYLCLDEMMFFSERRTILNQIDYSGAINEETIEALENNGMFMLLCTKPISKERLLDLYFTRDQVEKVFEIVKQYANGLPVYNQKEETFRGHLLFTFIATVIHKLLSDALYKSGYTAEDVINSAHDLQCLVFDDKILINEAKRQVTEPFSALKIQLPDSISRQKEETT